MKNRVRINKYDNKILKILYEYEEKRYVYINRAND